MMNQWDCMDRPDLEEVLHEEINRLPRHERTAVVLCILEGRSVDRAADELGWPVGTLRRRLSRAIECLRVRAAIQGMMIRPGCSVIDPLAGPMARPPRRLIESTVAAARRVRAHPRTRGEEGKRT